MLAIRRNQISQPVAVAITSALVVVLAALLLSTSAATTLRERIWDQFLRKPGPPVDAQVIVVDIDRDALDPAGLGSWSRMRLAEVVGLIADVEAKALGIDILLAGHDERSPGALARNLATVAIDPRDAALATSLAEKLPDGDKILAASLRRIPTVVGAVLDDDRKPEAERPPTTILVRGRPNLNALWQARGTIGPIAIIADEAQGSGILMLPGDDDASVRRLPLLVVADRALQPGLALEVARLGSDASSYLLGGSPLTLNTAELRIRLSPDGMLRLRPTSREAQKARTIPVLELLRSKHEQARLKGRIVLIGSSAPELGGRRPSGSGESIPTVQIQADAVEQILRADAPMRPAMARWLELLAALITALATVSAALWLAPLFAGSLAVAGALAWTLVCFTLARGPGLLIDPLLVPSVAIAGYALASLAAAAVTRRRETLIRRRFEQHLSPAVVQRIVEQPDLLKLKGESRIVTALFTDIEGFTSMTERAEPAVLVSVLDRYIDGASRIVTEHGGMLEKIVGDALHCLFNAPLDLPDHPRRALECAEALVVFTQRIRETPEAKRIGLGRTRFGIETGRVIVGDVGGGRKLDYTAHGNAMNRAARLEAANKELGSAICVGEGAAAHIDPTRLRPLGGLQLRGVANALAAFEPWPAAMTDVNRMAYLEAIRLLDTNPVAAMHAFAVLQREAPDDKVITTLLARAAGLAGSPT